MLREVGRDLGYNLRLFTDRDKWTNIKAAAKVTYGTQAAGQQAVILPAHSFLSGRNPTEEDLVVKKQGDLRVFFHTNDGPDLLACGFFALSRYEEYQPFTADSHDRFPASESHAQRNGYLHLPVVRAYTHRLADQLREVFPGLPAQKKRAFHLAPTYDIDMLWAYHHRSWKGIASGLRDVLTGQPSRAKDRFFSKEQTDPYANLGYLLALHPNVKPFIFWLLSDNEQREDVNPYPVPAAQTAVMHSLRERASHGIHPGYATIETAGKLRAEIEQYTTAFGLAPRHSRQHFLRLSLPGTYRALRNHGISDDHSMGYGDAVGWRAGTNLPFHWYDLEREEATGLIIHPFAVMDVTLKNYLELSPEAASQKIDDLMEAVRPYGGEFTLLWHNSSFAKAHGWDGWREVYEKLW